MTAGAAVPPSGSNLGPLPIAATAPAPVAAGSATAFLAGDGEMAERIRAFDWDAVGLGPPQRWRPTLKAMVRMALCTRHPIFIFWGPEHRCLYNDAYRASLGAEKHPSILGMRGREAWPEIWPIIGPQIDRVLRGEGATWHENQLVPIVRHGGIQDVYWAYSYGPIDDDEAPNGVGGVLVICSETTELVTGKRRLELERERFAQLFEQAPTFMAMLRGPEHVFELANPEYLRVIADRPILGRRIADALPEAVEQGYVAVLDGVYRSGEAFAATGARYRAQRTPEDAGEERIVDFVYQPIRDADGAVTGIFVQGVDVTERHQAEAALREADRRKDAFVATLAHELRNPLAAIATAAQLLSAPDPDTERLAWCAGLIQRNSRAMTLLLDDLLDASRMTTGKLTLRKTRAEVRPIVDAAVETVWPLAQSRRHGFELALPPALPAIEVDPLRITQVLANLLTNAVKYTEPGGRIRLEVALDGGQIVFAVHDDGVGIAAEMLPSMFEMFTQAPRTLDRAAGGLGIGLAFSKGLVELHGGRIEAISEGVGKGAVFRVTLPIVDGTAG